MHGHVRQNLERGLGGVSVWDVQGGVRSRGVGKGWGRGVLWRSEAGQTNKHVAG